MKTVIYCEKADDVPKESHWAIVKFSTYQTPDPYDTHRMPTLTEHKASYTAYTVEAEWRDALVALTLDKTPAYNESWTAFFVNVAKTKTTVTVDISV